MRFPHGKGDGSWSGNGREHRFWHNIGTDCGHGLSRQERLKRCEALQSLGRFPLTELPEGKRARVVVNPDEQTIAMGLFCGQVVMMSKNDAGQDKLVVCVGESRLIIPTKTAKSIIVR